MVGERMVEYGIKKGVKEDRGKERVKRGDIGNSAEEGGWK